jgi:hypothetical protein
MIIKLKAEFRAQGGCTVIEKKIIIVSYAISLKFAGSITDEVIGLFN